MQISSTTPIGLNNNHLNIATTSATTSDPKPLSSADTFANHSPYQRSSPASAEQTSAEPATHKTPSTNGSTAKYKSNIMEKYLRDLQPDAFAGKDPMGDDGIMGNGEGRELSKWLESAANFTPDKKNYIEWEGGVRCVSLIGSCFPAENLTQCISLRIKDPKAASGRTTSECPSDQSAAANHEREELEAAEALTSLAGNYRNRMFGTATLARH